MQTSDIKIREITKLANIRGIDEFSTSEMAMIADLAHTSLTPVEILNEVRRAPKHRVENTLKTIRSKVSSVLTRLSETVKP